MLGITHSQVPVGAALHDDRRSRARMLAVIAAVAVAFAIAGALALALGDGGAPAPVAPEPALQQSVTQPGLRYDGGPEEGTRGAGGVFPANPGRPDGGPDEGTRGPGH